jgi:NAD+ kinase
MIKIGIFGKNLNKETYPFIQNLIDKLGEVKSQIFIFEDMYQMVKDHIKMPQPKTFRYHEDIRKKLDFFVSLGGDGNMLSAVTLVRDSGIPIIGINLGSFK